MSRLVRNWWDWGLENGVWRDVFAARIWMEDRKMGARATRALALQKEVLLNSHLECACFPLDCFLSHSVGAFLFGFPWRPACIAGVRCKKRRYTYIRVARRCIFGDVPCLLVDMKRVPRKKGGETQRTGVPWSPQWLDWPIIGYTYVRRYSTPPAAGGRRFFYFFGVVILCSIVYVYSHNFVQHAGPLLFRSSDFFKVAVCSDGSQRHSLWCFQKQQLSQSATGGSVHEVCHEVKDSVCDLGASD